MEKLPIYKLVINPDADETGVDFVALVDQPAIQINWQKFNEQFGTDPKDGESQDDYLARCIPDEINAGHDQPQAAAICYSKWDNRNKNKFNFKVENTEKQIVSGPLMVADMPIYRRDSSGEYYAVFDAPTIEQIVLKFSKNKAQNNVNLMHDGQRIVDGVFMYESFIIDRKRGVMPPTGFEELTDGSWFGSYKVENTDVWNMVKEGTFQGFSVEGVFGQVKVDEQPQNDIEQLIEDIIFITEKLHHLKQ